MKKHFLTYTALLCVVAATLSGCSGGADLRASATGTSYEALVVMENSYWKGGAGEAVRSHLAADMVAMPQAEPTLSLSHTNLNGFSNILKPVRNIFIADIDSTKYTRPKVSYLKDHWSRPQSVVRVVAPNEESFIATMNEIGTKITHYYVSTEIQRQNNFYATYTNKEAKERIFKKFGVQLTIPNDMGQITEKDNFMWITDTKGKVRRDIVIYSYPYTDVDTFTKEYLLAKRDSVMKEHITGEFDDSYMGTEYNHIPPVFNAIAVQENAYAAELRGLWRIYNGSAMGGPFVSHTRLDEINQRIITVEAFVYGAGHPKRNPLRQMEAVVYSLKLPQEINALKEVQIVSDKK